MPMLRRQHTRAYLCLLLVLVPCCGFQHYMADEEAQLLLQIKSAWGDPPVLAEWNASASAAHCIFGRLNKLQDLDLSENNLTGHLVVDGFAAVSLKMIYLGDNNLSGIIPDFFGRLENLTDLILYNNNFCGEIPASITRLPSLSYLDLENNRFNGTLPPELGKHSLYLAGVSVGNNDLTGAIPEGLCNGGNLYSFSASSNRLNGSIPAGLANCAALIKLNLGSNQLSGQVR
ncbi:hypothetical protein PR202_gb13519 [Eleusine coracana subsp. coracana]|uniref:Leucine-rich repeat-containing N-terminal plant-type domain-containing protein n=1 Tax=Eleusine coracana subsp. coracana TaxID=191504 RepID=A0AAV5ESU8_ELECO|nr:hypothetical protein PR202_gb13519 [Eleusine coracana subsp. coracana]